jgi:hypothetical protein
MIKSYFAALLVFAALLIGLVSIGAALTKSSIANAAVSETAALQSSLPPCLNLESDIAEIQRVQKANDKTSFKYDGTHNRKYDGTHDRKYDGTLDRKYDGYRKILHAATALELATRLAYAETMAANCVKQQDRIVDLVASVIGNRVRIRGGDVHSVIFQRDQFASSLNFYSESRYRDFLCPSDRELWNKVLAKMRTNLEQSKPSGSVSKDTVNYYLYRHSARFKAPNWKLEEVVTSNEEIRECIRVFRDPAWE